MTRAYDDIEAVTRLLEEKEKDLELTVQIGKELLTQNNALENRICELESDLKSTNDDRAQLLHELHKKNELISVLTNDSDDGTEGDTPTLSKSITHDLLQKKIASLQNENKSLKMEVEKLACDTDDIEAQERQLVEDITAQLNSANNQFDHLSLELERQREENRLQHEQIVSLTERLAEAEMRLHQLTHDNEENVTLLSITKENQNSLALELVEFKQRYQEVLALLQETQEQLRKQRKKQLPQARSSFMSSMLQPDSLQSELMESSMFSENSLDSGISTDTQRANDRIGRLMSQVPGVYGGGIGAGGMSSSMVGGIAGGAIPPYKRVFETVRCASKNGNYADSGDVTLSQIGAMSMSTGATGPRMSAGYVHPAGSYYHDSGSVMGGKTYSSESLATQSDDDNYPSQPIGVPGAPGAKELEAALKRLTPAEVLARRAMLSHGPLGSYSYDDQQQTTHQLNNTATKDLPLGIRTPDSIMSTGSSGVSSTFMNLSSSTTSNQWRLPEKLQIVKPIEGSQTLHHWSRLATPTLSGLLEERPGVTIRGGRGLDDLGMQTYTLSDVEEDYTEDLPPGKQYLTQGSTYTYTMSTVMHPDDGGLMTDLSFLSQSQMSSRMASTSTSRQPSCPPTPRAGLSRKNSCSTFSVNHSLAAMLNERGIKAVTPSALNTPAGPNFTPTVTPCNSPEGSPTRSMSPEPLFGLLSSGADMIRRKLVGGDIERPNRNQQQSKHQQQRQEIMLSRLERRALRSLKLMEKVESIGLENIIAKQPNSSGIANRSSSPMSQLSSIRSIQTSTNSIVDDLHFDREQIKDVLNKGLKSQQQQQEKGRISSNKSSDDDGRKECDNLRKSDKSRGAAAEQQATTSVNSSSRSSQVVQQKKTQVVESSSVAAAAAASTLPSASETRLKQMQRQKSRRNLKNGMAGQRPDLGTIAGASSQSGGSGGTRLRSDLGKVGPGAAAMKAAGLSKEQDNILNGGASGSSSNVNVHKQRNSRQQASSAESDERVEQSLTQSFVGTVSSLLFGRKGGWL